MEPFPNKQISFSTLTWKNRQKMVKLIDKKLNLKSFMDDDDDDIDRAPK